MIVIGEKLNTSIKNVRIAVQQGDDAALQDIALAQSNAGADYIDVNCGTFVEDEPDRLKWMVDSVQQCTDKPLCIDSPNPRALEAALRAHRNGKPIINSITAQKERYKEILPLVINYKSSVIALCMDDKGIPDTLDGRVSIAEKLVNNLIKEGLPCRDIFIDPMIQPMATNQSGGLMALKTISTIKQALPDVNTVCGISNISFGLPARALINEAFLVLAIEAGLDAAILDPLDHDLIPLIYAAELICREDEYCLGYLESIRNLGL